MNEELLVGAMSGVVLIHVLTFLGTDIKHAIAISIVSVIATSSGSASAYVRDRITNLKVGMFLEMFTILGALLGAAIRWWQPAACCSFCSESCSWPRGRPCSASRARTGRP